MKREQSATLTMQVIQKFVFTGLMLGYGAVVAQTVTLDSCIAWAYQVQKFADNRQLIRQGQVLAMDNSGKMNLPSLVLDGTATYQNENITISVPPATGFEIPEVPLNFNRLLVNFNQTIYNGRLATHKKLIDSLAYDSKAYQLAVDKIKLKAKITSLYSSVILLREQQQILSKQMATLEAKARQLQGAIDAGVAYKSDMLNLRAEALNLRQNRTDLEYLERSLRQQLAALTAHDLSPATTFVLPEVAVTYTGVAARPELKLINSRQRLLMARINLSAASRQPYVGVFGSVGVGYPGYDIFNPSVRPMALVGLQVKWQLIDWQKSKNERQLLQWDRDILSYQYDRVKLQLEAELIKQQQEIAKYEELITRDREILQLRQEVTQEVSARLSGGTATATDFIIQVNNEAVAEINRSIHLIKLTLAKINYTILQGD